jgi:hypothetical protein
MAGCNRGYSIACIDTRRAVSGARRAALAQKARQAFEQRGQTRRSLRRSLEADTAVLARANVKLTEEASNSLGLRYGRHSSGLGLRADTGRDGDVDVLGFVALRDHQVQLPGSAVAPSRWR